MLTHMRAAGLARCHNFVSALLQVLGKQAVLGAFPRAVNSLESDEQSTIFQDVSGQWFVAPIGGDLHYMKKSSNLVPTNLTIKHAGMATDN